MYHVMNKKTTIVLLMFMFVISAFSQNMRNNRARDIFNMKWWRVATQMPDEWYGSDEALRIAENVLVAQKDIGGWVKNYPYHHIMSDSDRTDFVNSKGEIGGTIDNGATTTEMRFLAKVFSHKKDLRYKDAFDRGLDYILMAQYENGGWPQFYPPRNPGDEYATDKTVPYSMHITYNDDAMVNVMRLLKNIFSDIPLYKGLDIGDDVKNNAKQAFDKGVDCILATQIIKNGKPTVWCAQHDFRTLEPVMARSYELESYSGGESVGVVLLLMDIDNPSDDVKNSIEYAVKWFDDHKINGIRIDIVKDCYGRYDRIVVKDDSAKPVWARFYDLETEKPYFCDRDGVKKESLAEIGYERRNGYSWYTYSPEILYERYYEWKQKHGKIFSNNLK